MTVHPRRFSSLPIDEGMTIFDPVVISENDAVGYSANRTLAWTRINTDV